MITWQEQEPNNWLLGEPVRGIVRNCLAQVCWNPNSREWCCIVYDGPADRRFAGEGSLVRGVEWVEDHPSIKPRLKTSQDMTLEGLREEFLKLYGPPQQPDEPIIYKGRPQ